METAALYERVLLRLPAPALRDGVDAVVREELVALGRAVGDVAAAFAKLQEVRAAAQSLGDGSAGCSASLQQALDDTTQLQRRLERRLAEALDGMGAGEQTSKRRKVEETDVKEPGDAVPPSRPAPREVVRVTVRLNEKRDCSSTDVSIPESMKKMHREECMEVMARFTRLPAAERNALLPEMLLKLSSVMPQMADQSATVVVMRSVLVWAHFVSGPRSIKAVRDFCDAVYSWIKGRRSNVGFRRLFNKLSKLLDQLSLETGKGTSDDVHLGYDLYLWYAHAMTTEERRKHVPPAISALREEINVLRKDMSRNKMQHGEVVKAAKMVMNWALNDPQDPNLLKLYDEFVQDMKLYADMLPDISPKVELTRVIVKFDEMMHGPPQSTTEERAQNALSWAQQLKQAGKGPSVQHIDKGLLMVDELIRHKEKGWKPRYNSSMKECVTILRTLTMNLKKGIRDQRLSEISKWNIRDRK